MLEILLLSSQETLSRRKLCWNYFKLSTKLCHKPVIIRFITVCYQFALKHSLQYPSYLEIQWEFYILRNNTENNILFTITAFHR